MAVSTYAPGCMSEDHGCKARQEEKWKKYTTAVSEHIKCNKTKEINQKSFAFIEVSH